MNHRMDIENDIVLKIIIKYCMQYDEKERCIKIMRMTIKVKALCVDANESYVGCSQDKVMLLNKECRGSVSLLCVVEYFL